MSSIEGMPEYDPLRVRCVTRNGGMLSADRIRICAGECDDYQGRVFAKRMAVGARGAARRGLARHLGVARGDVPGDDRDVEGVLGGTRPARRERAARRDRGGAAEGG